MKVILSEQDKKRFAKLADKLASEVDYIRRFQRLDFADVSSVDVDVWNKLDKILKLIQDLDYETLDSKRL